MNADMKQKQSKGLIFFYPRSTLTPAPLPS